MIVLGTLRIRCSTCGAEYQINTDSLDKDVFLVGEFNMGARVQHEYVGEIECESCGRLMLFKVFAHEYPIGAKEYQGSEVEGCEILEEPIVAMEIPEQMLSVYDMILQNPQSVFDLDPWEFENLVAEVYRLKGFNTVVTKRTRDGGKDIIATCDVADISYSTYFECKQQNPRHPVGVDVIRGLYGVMESDRIDKGVVVTTSYFTKDAIDEAESLNGRIELVDYNKLQKLIKR